MLIAGYSHSLTGTDWINRTRTGLKFAGTELRSHSIRPMRTFLSHRAAENRAPCHAGMPNFFQEPLHHSPLQPKTNDAEIFYEWHHIAPLQTMWQTEILRKTKAKKERCIPPARVLPVSEHPPHPADG